jgi:hypothetical protein
MLANIALIGVQAVILGGLFLFLSRAWDSGWWAVFVAAPFVIAWGTWLLSEPWERDLYRATVRRLLRFGSSGRDRN